MNHGNFNGIDDWTQYCDGQLSDSYLPPVTEQGFDNNRLYMDQEHEFEDNQSNLFRTTTNIAAQASEVMQPGLTTKQYQHKALSSETAKVDTTSQTTGRLVNGRGGDPAKLERKRERDREYRQRCKDKKKRTEEELKVLRKEVQTRQQLQELKTDDEQNDSDQLCKIEFRLDCENYKLRGEAMKAVGEFPGTKCFSMDVEEKILRFYGNNIDTLPLQHKLKEICNARMLSFSIVKKKDEEKKDGRIVMDMVVARNSTFVAQNSMSNSPSSSTFPHLDSNGGRAEGLFQVSQQHLFRSVQLLPDVADYFKQ